MATKKGTEAEGWELCDSENGSLQGQKSKTNNADGLELSEPKVVSELRQEVAALKQQIIQMQTEIKKQLSKENLSVCGDADFPSFTLLQKQQSADQFSYSANQTSKSSVLKINTGKPQAASIWTISTLGEIFVQSDVNASELPDMKSKVHVQELDVTGCSTPISVPLDCKCVPGTEIIVTGYIPEDAERMHINLDAEPSSCKRSTENSNINFHFNPRFENDPYETDVLVRNTMTNGLWGAEERKGGMPFELGKEFSVKIINDADCYIVYVSDKLYCTYEHRLPPHAVIAVSLWQDVEPFKVTIKYPAPLTNPNKILCQQIGGHLKKVESCNLGVTWGIGYDHTVWIYNGGWGGSFFGNVDNHQVNPMVDHEDHYVEENQRWNAITGYSSVGMITDDTWRNEMDKEKIGQDLVKLLSVDWHWVSDWQIDFQVPGSDNEGWQYSMNPSSAENPYIEYMRKRRRHRRCAIKTAGPWLELKDYKLLDVSLESLDDNSDAVILVWAVASDGQIMTRSGVSQSNPMGTAWKYVSSDQTVTSVSCGPYRHVWAVGKNGKAYCRIGINRENLMGDSWKCVPLPNNLSLKQVSTGQIGLWAVDINGNLHVRQGITHDLPQGTHWQRIPINAYDAGSTKVTFEQVSAGRNEVWVITSEGKAKQRLGISSDNPTGVAWSSEFPGKWQHFSARAV